MQKFWEFANHTIPEFEMFSIVHIITIVVTVLFLVLLFKISPKINKSKKEKYYRYTIAVVMIVLEGFLFRKKLLENGAWYGYFPDATCGWSTYLAIIMILTKNKKLFKIVFFWCFGVVLSFLFPELYDGPQRFEFYRYFLSHFMIFVSVFYMMWVHGFEFYKKDYLYCVMISIAFISIFIIANFIVSDPDIINFFYTMKPPVSGTPLDLFLGMNVGLYAFVWLLVASIVGLLWVLPFWKNKNRGR